MLECPSRAHMQPTYAAQWSQEKYFHMAFCVPKCEDEWLRADVSLRVTEKDMECLPVMPTCEVASRPGKNIQDSFGAHRPRWIYILHTWHPSIKIFRHIHLNSFESRGGDSRSGVQCGHGS